LGPEVQTPMPVSHVVPPEQPASLAQLVVHALGPHTYGLQLWVPPSTHVPEPLH
jgi:hypothetical protein